MAGPIEEAVKVADAEYNCNAYACRGYQYDDNADLLQTYATGDVVTFHIDMIAGHRPGHAVSNYVPSRFVQAASMMKTCSVLTSMAV